MHEEEGTRRRVRGGGYPIHATGNFEEGTQQHDNQMETNGRRANDGMLPMAEEEGTLRYDVTAALPTRRVPYRGYAVSRGGGYAVSRGYVVIPGQASTITEVCPL